MRACWTPERKAAFSKQLTGRKVVRGPNKRIRRDKGSKRSPEICAKMKACWTPERRRANGERTKEWLRTHPNHPIPTSKGLKHTVEHNWRMSQIIKQQWASGMRKWSGYVPNAFKGRKHKPESIERMKATWTPERRELIGLARRKRAGLLTARQLIRYHSLKNLRWTRS